MERPTKVGPLFIYFVNKNRAVLGGKILRKAYSFLIIYYRRNTYESGEPIA